MSTLRFHTQCIPCLLEKALKQIPKEADETEKLCFAKTVLHIMSDAPVNISAPEIVARITELQKTVFGIEDNFSEVKKYFNNLMMTKEKTIENKILSAEDSLYMALCFAMIGNYIDFGALNNVNEEYLDSILVSPESHKFDSAEYANFKKDLENAKNLVYITDNCGEIVMDKLFIKQLFKEFPSLSVDVIVRGAPVLNDATTKDAVQVGLTEIVPVTDNGTNIAGTCLDRISEKAKQIIDNADVIIAKGQGNFETLNHCGKNIYYLFLCKCNLFAERFGKEKCSGMLLNDIRL